MYQRNCGWFTPPPPSVEPIKPFVPDGKAVSVLDGKPYTPEVHTNVQATWRRFGWKPLAERLAESK